MFKPILLIFFFVGSCILYYVPIQTTRVIVMRLGPILLLCSIAMAVSLLVPACRSLVARYADKAKRGGYDSRAAPIILSNLELSREAAKLNLYVQAFPSVGPYSPDKASPVSLEPEPIEAMT